MQTNLFEGGLVLSQEKEDRHIVDHAPNIYFGSIHSTMDVTFRASFEWEY